MRMRTILLLYLEGLTNSIPDKLNHQFKPFFNCVDYIYWWIRSFIIVLLHISRWQGYHVTGLLCNRLTCDKGDHGQGLMAWYGRSCNRTGHVTGLLCNRLNMWQVKRVNQEEGLIIWQGWSYGRVDHEKGLIIWQCWSCDRVDHVTGLIMWQGWW